MSRRMVTARMGEAKKKMIALSRIPSAFYLNGADFAEFIETAPPQIASSFRRLRCYEFGFELVPVRASRAKNAEAGSRLFCTRGTSVGVPAK